jgi:hypothetical protein
MLTISQVLLMMVKLPLTHQRHTNLQETSRVKLRTTLNIPAGTKIEGTGGTASYTVAQGGKLNVNGTASNQSWYD